MTEITKYSIDKEINTLGFLKNLIVKFNDLYFVGDFDIDPFTKWSTAFSSEYWHLKYYLLKDGEVKLSFDEDNFVYLCEEKKLNINWLTITDKVNFKLECVDGDWQIEILNSSFNQLNELLNFDN